MNTTVNIPATKKDMPTARPAPKRGGALSLTAFLARYTDREDPYKYEWDNGKVEKKPRSINRDQFHIFQNLLLRLMRTAAFAEKAMFICEVDMYLPQAKRTRRADIAFLSGTQMQESVHGEPTVCEFVIEIVSKNDQANELSEKILEYFANGVKVLWIIYPKIGKTEVWTSPRQATICFGTDVCSAAPVLPDFSLTAAEILL